MLTVGVDLAAEAARTAVAALRWGPGRVDVVTLVLGADDARVLGAVAGANRAALDFPFGWPDPFVDFLGEHRNGHVVAPAGSTGLAWRRRLSRRGTDLTVERDTGLRPLSVSADRIAAVAMRGASLLGMIAASDPRARVLQPGTRLSLLRDGPDRQRLEHLDIPAQCDDREVRLGERQPAARPGQPRPLLAVLVADAGARSSDDAVPQARPGTSFPHAGC